ncbi:small GTP-binding protein, putative [Trichomonas vaginalis G3]|uniref:Small GTP-binding protein, putative n=1 Tax=Trichomonas vaginalis (strain ATCC PRA-98 / G3) TaxID=412133 RepID=A2DWL9_TRIV3|nr:GTPase protein [Trichomonas vaginalis G3]EAY15204.1 small GTP-binding protein, putative [Trichomonas vaginalis G3]KAI5550642.1 GTPase protein [Trichomonas vaginalis G3]|eukprot:XP_001327427.1 small GTP-binding protein [Trichomonas vaginalis G3]
MQASDSTTFRAVTIGESSVGKTCLVNRFIRNKFNNAEANTVGAIYDTYTERRGDQSIEVQIWDTAGQEKFRSLAPVYYRGADAAVVVFDMTKPSTFQCLQSWIDDFKGVAGEQSAVIIVGNKVDLTDQIKISQMEALEWATAHGVKFFQTSAKTGEGVKELFTAVVDILMTRRSEGEVSGVTTLTKRKNADDGKRCC